MAERLVEDRIDGSSGFLILPTIFPLPVIEKHAACLTRCLELMLP